MSEPPRLVESGSDPCRQLLRSARNDDRHANASMARAAAALGLAAGAAAASASTTAAAATSATGSSSTAVTGSLAAKATSSVVAATWFGVGKWFGLGVLGGVVTLAGANQVVPRPRIDPALVQGVTAPNAIVTNVGTPEATPRYTPTLETSEPVDIIPADSVGSIAMATSSAKGISMDPIAASPVGTVAPDVPSAAAREPSAPDLAADLAMLDRARAVLAAGRTDEALRCLQEYDREKRSQVLAPEAMLIRIEAYTRSGQRDQAISLAQVFVKRYPTNPQTRRLHALVAGASGNLRP